MNISVKDVIDAVVANFLRLPPEQRRRVLRILSTDLDAPQQTDDEPKLEKGVFSGGLLGWLVESLPPTDIAEVFRHYLPDFSPDSLTDPQQIALANRQLSSLSPLVLYELHQKFIDGVKKDQLLTPDEIVEKTWGTIRETDKEVLREIIEDEEYCGQYPPAETNCLIDTNIFLYHLPSHRCRQRRRALCLEALNDVGKKHQASVPANKNAMNLPDVLHLVHQFQIPVNVFAYFPRRCFLFFPAPRSDASDSSMSSFACATAFGKRICGSSEGRTRPPSER
jgi:hypothetical protein